MSELSSNYLIENFMRVMEISRSINNKPNIHSRNKLEKILKCLVDSTYNDKGTVIISKPELIELLKPINISLVDTISTLTRNKFILFKHRSKSRVDGSYSLIYEIVL